MPLPEKSLIARIRRQVRKRRGIIAGIGDDCAVLRIPSGHEALVTTDFSLEGVHFRREWHPPESVGHRCLTRGLSDIAAMGGEPIAVFVSLAVPRQLPQRWVDAFAKGLLALADKFNVSLAGGDTAQSPAGILADVMVLGSVTRGKAILRSGAKPGDRIYVSGSLGASAATVNELMKKRKLKAPKFPAHFFPEPRIHLGQFLRDKNMASAMIDVSDGLSTDLGHICEESEVGAQIQAAAIPRANIAKQSVNLETALHGGEDYELLFTAPQSKSMPVSIAGVPIMQIGQITQAKQIILLDKNGVPTKLEAKGWQHFKNPK